MFPTSFPTPAALCQQDDMIRHEKFKNALGFLALPLFERGLGLKILKFRTVR